MTSDLERARALFSRALAAHLARDWEGAEDLYRQALALAPGRPSLVFNLGRLMLDRERNAEAGQFFDEAVRAAPDDHEARYNLGVALARQGRFDEACVSYDRAIALRSDFAEAHSGRGAALDALGRHDAALASHARSISLQPERAEFQAGFCRSAIALGLDARKVAGREVEQAVLACLAGRNVDYQALGPVAWPLVRQRLQRSGLEVAAADFDLLHAHRQRPQALGDVCRDPLLLASLSKITVGDRATETMFTALRASLLRLVGPDAVAAELREVFTPLALALAQQCFLNEYVWDVTAAEQALVDQAERQLERTIASGTPSSAALGIVGCYAPLAGKPPFADWCRTESSRASPELAALVRMQLTEPAMEAEISGRLRQLGDIRDDTSRAVKAQYEENPYPRWLGFARNEPAPYTAQILREIAPFSPHLKPVTDAPRVLIAGCGTGRHAIMYATAYRGARVTAIDLSRASLAYAARKAGELGVDNIEFLCADVLDVEALGASFDVISSVGVLHHMADPAEGLRRLRAVLAPGGYMMLGLYSEAARRDIVALRSIIAQEGFTPTAEGIRACRRHIASYPGNRFGSLVGEAADFYSTSMVRDLLFHVMEHRFTIPRIAALLGENGLRFLGFTFADPAAKARYRKAYPDDPDMLGLANWAALESAHPWLFRAMYQFWTTRSDGGA
jgi:SAM-dependent methyltransferase